MPGQGVDVIYLYDGWQLARRRLGVGGVYLGFLAEYAGQFGLDVLGCCLMTNHVHLVAIPEVAWGTFRGGRRKVGRIGPREPNGHCREDRR